eukprot:9503830-Pyramimonas_sp.AAC.3
MQRLTRFVPVSHKFSLFNEVSTNSDDSDLGFTLHCAHSWSRSPPATPVMHNKKHGCVLLYMFPTYPKVCRAKRLDDEVKVALVANLLRDLKHAEKM